MARLVPADEIDTHLSKTKGWLEDDDPFFDAIDGIVKDRAKHVPRIFNAYQCHSLSLYKLSPFQFSQI